MRRILLGALCAFTYGVAPVNAQTTSQDTVIRFVEVLLGSYSQVGERPEVILGAPARGLAILLGPATPGGALGSISFEDAGTTVYERDRPAELHDSIATAVENLGWRRQVPPINALHPEGVSTPTVICSGDTLAIVLGVGRGHARALMVGHFSGPEGPCAPTQVSHGNPGREELGHPTPPHFTPLPGGKPIGSSYGGSSADWYFGQVQETALSLDQVFTHYADALLRAGWKVGPAASAPGVIAASLSTPGTEGDTWVGVLTVSAGARPNVVTIRIAMDSPRN